MTIKELLYKIADAGISLTCSRTEDRLVAKPTRAVTPELADAIREHKAEIIQFMREDEEMRRSGTIQSERQVFELARRHLVEVKEDTPARDEPPEELGSLTLKRAGLKGLTAKWSKEFGFITLHDPTSGESHDVPIEDAPGWAKWEAGERKRRWRAGDKKAFDLTAADMAKIWEAEYPPMPKDEGIVEEHPLEDD